MSTAPDTFIGAPVPEHLKRQWRTWEAAAWRQQQHRADNRLFPPDERFNVDPPKEMCPIHEQMWLDYRNMHFDPISGNRWPGHPGSPFIVAGNKMSVIREERRVEWDEKASAAMRQVERICLAGNSPQCGPGDGPADVVAMPQPRSRTVTDLPLPAEAS
ncbi:hypothetical protein [Streptomyces sp. enrichment culture]|uniref:hypothetical protein n=1 Tax=Streptomyces sp. enrichment culture TaxID=1795815 RepID=UPI003F557FBC